MHFQGVVRMWRPHVVSQAAGGVTAGESDAPQGVVNTSDGRVVRAFHRFTLVDQTGQGRDLTKGRRRDQVNEQVLPSPTFPAYLCLPLPTQAQAALPCLHAVSLPAQAQSGETVCLQYLCLCRHSLQSPVCVQYLCLCRHRLTSLSACIKLVHYHPARQPSTIPIYDHPHHAALHEICGACSLAPCVEQRLAHVPATCMYSCAQALFTGARLLCKQTGVTRLLCLQPAM